MSENGKRVTSAMGIVGVILAVVIGTVAVSSTYALGEEVETSVVVTVLPVGNVNGDVMYSVDGSEYTPLTSQNIFVPLGSTVSFMATADFGYEVSYWESQQNNDARVRTDGASTSVGPVGSSITMYVSWSQVAMSVIQIANSSANATSDVAMTNPAANVESEAATMGEGETDISVPALAVGAFVAIGIASFAMAWRAKQVV